MSTLKAIFETDDYDQAIEYARFVAKKSERETIVRGSGETWQSHEIWHVFMASEAADYFLKGRSFTAKESKSVWGVGWVQCERCHGSGQLEDLSGGYDCPECDGSGRLEVACDGKDGAQ